MASKDQPKKEALEQLAQWLHEQRSESHGLPAFTMLTWGRYVNDIHMDRCDKCQKEVPWNFIAIELEDGHPIDDPAGFQWCIVCHSIRVIGIYKGKLEAAEVEIVRLRSEVKRLDHIYQNWNTTYMQETSI